MLQAPKHHSNIRRVTGVVSLFVCLFVAKQFFWGWVGLGADKLYDVVLGGGSSILRKILYDWGIGGGGV